LPSKIKNWIFLFAFGMFCCCIVIQTHHLFRRGWMHLPTTFFGKLTKNNVFFLFK
jgi:hypothetical protein